jgi:ABC-type phosphate transport system substrate-binding protein
MKAFIASLLGLTVLALVPTPGVQAGPDDIVVIVNKANPASVLPRDMLRPIFQTTKSEWSDGTNAEPVNLPETDDIRQRFDAAVLGLKPDGVLKYWIDRKIRGGERPPRGVGSEAAALRFVENTRGGVGYMRASAVDPAVKIVARIRGSEVEAP